MLPVALTMNVINCDWDAFNSIGVGFELFVQNGIAPMVVFIEPLV